MAYSDDAVKAKLNSLNETQDSIVANAQWIMFHRRHADRTASLWLKRLEESPIPKRLNLIYLANEVVQQSRARGKQDFMLAFEPVVADATASAYKGASQEVQGKIRRVVEVWRQRSIFDLRILETVEARMTEVDKSKGMKTGGKLGGSLFGGNNGSVPAELDSVAKSLTAVTKADALSKPAINTANIEFAKMTDANTPLPTPPVHAARLSALMRNLASAQGAVEASISARRELLAGLEKLVESNRTKLSEDEAVMSELTSQKEGIEIKKKDVEDGIMRGLSNPGTPSNAPTPPNLSASDGQTNGTAAGYNHGAGPEAPEAEGFTPPPPEIEAFTPPAQDSSMANDETAPVLGEAAATDYILPNDTNVNAKGELPVNLNEPPPAFEPPPALQSSRDSVAAADDFLNNLNTERLRQASTEIPSTSMVGNPGDPRLKRRKLSHPKPASNMEDEMFGSQAVGGVDEDGVAAMLGQ